MRADSNPEVTLATLAADPTLAERLEPPRARAMLREIATLIVTVSARAASEPERSKTELSPQLIDVKSLGKVLGKSADFIYEHHSEWPFVVKLSSRDLMFDVNKLNRWLAQRTGK